MGATGDWRQERNSQFQFGCQQIRHAALACCALVAPTFRKVVQLFAPRGYPWRCRHCYDLTYATRQAGLRYRLTLKAQKVRERLGSDDLGIANPFPAKPKGMHWQRYERLHARHDQALNESLKLLKL